MAFDDLKHAQRERLEYLDQCLTWRGMANRRDLVVRFEISIAQAALDFRMYLERSGKGAPFYDTGRKTYLTGPEFIPLTTANPNMMAEFLLDQPSPHPADSLPRLERRNTPEVIAQLYRAMHSKMAIKVCYISMTTGDSEAQWIVPTRFASDGERLHLRAYSCRRDAYRDYLPIRIKPESDFSCRKLTSPLPNDEDWHTLTRIHLRPHTNLSAAQAAVVRREYGFADETLCIEIRKALEFYAARRWGLDQSGARLEIAKVEYEAITDGFN